MVKVKHAIITDVAVSSSLWPENQAGLTEFEAVQLRSRARRNVVAGVEIENALGLGEDVTVPGMYASCRNMIEIL